MIVILNLNAFFQNCDDKENLPSTTVSSFYERLLELVIDALRKSTGSFSYRALCDQYQTEQSGTRCGRLLRLSMFVRLSREVVQRLQSLPSVDASASVTSGNSVDQVSALAEVIERLATGQLDGNPLVDLVSSPTNSISHQNTEIESW